VSQGWQRLNISVSEQAHDRARALAGCLATACKITYSIVERPIAALYAAGTIASGLVL